MATYGVSGIRIGAGGRINEVKLGLLSIHNLGFAEGPSVVPIESVIEVLNAGHDVVAVFLKQDGGLTIGGGVVAHQDDVETIEPSDPDAERNLMDLPVF